MEVIKKQPSFEAVIKNLTHELRTPLTVVKLTLNSLQEYLPALIENNRQKGSVMHEINTRDLNGLMKSLENSNKEIVYALNYLNLLLDKINSLHELMHLKIRRD